MYMYIYMYMYAHMYMYVTKLHRNITILSHLINGLIRDQRLTVSRSMTDCFTINDCLLKQATNIVLTDFVRGALCVTRRLDNRPETNVQLVVRCEAKSSIPMLSCNTVYMYMYCQTFCY